jgi:hypothetical protein
MISKNAASVPSNVRYAVGAFAIIAIVAVWLAHFIFSWIFGRYLWYAIGAAFLVLSIYIYGLRSEN